MLLRACRALINTVHLVRIGTDGGLSDADAASLLSYMSLGTGTMRIPIGFVADCIGRRRTMACLNALYSLLVALCALSALGTSVAYLRIFAFCVGGLTGGCLSTFPSLPAELLPARLRPLAATALMTPIGIGFVLGPVIAGAIVGASDSYLGAKLLSASVLAVAGVVLGSLPLCERQDGT